MGIDLEDIIKISKEAFKEVGEEYAAKKVARTTLVDTASEMNYSRMNPRGIKGKVNISDNMEVASRNKIMDLRTQIIDRSNDYEIRNPIRSVFNPNVRQDYNIEELTKHVTTKEAINPNIKYKGMTHYENFKKVQVNRGRPESINTRMENLWESNKQVIAGLGVASWIATEVSSGNTKKTNAQLYGF